MSAYQRIALADRGVEAAVAQGLLAAEEKLFRAATGKQPAIAAATLDPGCGRGLLFASLCGPSSYYGLSGCTLRGFVRPDAAGEWREIYNSEGMALYTDPNA
ncbi:MAG: hypothetical protein H0T56_16935, partial [Pseudaminobacter sp.]|nr:hypothetical protein [Pseudaminobacter sp.]